MEMFDSHSHYNDEKFDEDREEIIKEAYNSGVTRLIVAGYNLESSKEAVKIANKHDFIYAICGVSPNDVNDLPSDYLDHIRAQVHASKVVAIGEIGLDYYWNKENKELQKRVFKEQIELANELDLPIVIHTREAVMDTIDILKNQVKCENKGVFHCCPLNVELIKEALKLGYYISFAGPITFKNSKNANQVIEMVPLERMLVETDCPYLSPEPLRGKRNDSRNVKYIISKIAEVKNKKIEEIAKITYENASTIFKIK